MRAHTLAGALMLLAGGTLAAQGAPDLQGTWEGTLVNVPGRPGAPPVAVTIELGALPTTDGSCVPWKTTYREQGVVRGTKDYRLCRGTGERAYYVDEGDGVKLKATLLDDVLVSAFKAGPILLTTQLRVRGDTLTEEIFTASDQPSSEGVVTLETRSLQKIVAVRRRR